MTFTIPTQLGRNRIEEILGADIKHDLIQLFLLLFLRFYSGSAWTSWMISEVNLVPICQKYLQWVHLTMGTEMPHFSLFKCK